MDHRSRRTDRRLRGVAALALPVAILLTADASAAPINVDFDSSFGTPSSSYGAAAGSEAVGYWNQVDPTVASPQAVLDIDAMATGATVNVSAGEGIYAFDDSSTSGDDGALLDDELDVLPSAVGGSATVTISGLFAGEYTVFTYARDANTPSSETVTITVNGQSASVGATSDSFAGFVEGETHAVHTITLSAGQDLVITSTIEDDTGADFGMINGFQIVPEPNSFLLVASGLLGLALQRRRP